MDSQKATFARHLAARVASESPAKTPEGKRAPFGWQTAIVAKASLPPLVLEWPDLPRELVPTKFRLSIGLDQRDEKTVEAFLPTSGRVIGTSELRFVSLFQLYEVPLTPADFADIRREGLGLRLTRGGDLAIFTGGRTLPDALAPHLLVPGTVGSTQEFFARLDSLACVQPFGWMEGCVLDGLLDLAETPGRSNLRQAAQRHLDLFIRDGKLIYENPVSVPSDNHIYGIEGTLPFAALARTQPNSPLFDLALNFWMARRDSDGAIIDGTNTTSEGAYTIGYPLALLARARRSDEYEKLALTQLRVRQERLFDNQTFWRTRNADGVKGNRNWARGIAWELLGMARTLGVLRDRKDIGDLTASFARLAEWSLARQRPDGLWGVFTDEPTLSPDTAGSAGIGAAFALGVRYGWLPTTYRLAATRTLSGLQNHLTPDGFLGGVSQANKGGENLQRGSYRCIYQMGMGLKAQLIAALA